VEYQQIQISYTLISPDKQYFTVRGVTLCGVSTHTNILHINLPRQAVLYCKGSYSVWNINYHKRLKIELIDDMFIVHL